MQIIVLGMHRSGTSAITRLTAMMGAYFGSDSIALPPDRDNPKGFWERRDMLAANRELMRLSDCAWHVVHPWNASNILPLPAQLTQHMQAIVAELSAHPVSVIKDPRFCLTLPLWLPHMKNPHAVIVYRDPLEIAESLHIRNGMPLEYGLALWEFHTVHAIHAAHALPKIFINHAALMQNPVAETQKLFTSLAAESLHMPSEKQITEFIDPRLHRARGKNISLALTAHQETLAAQWRGELPMDSKIQVSQQSLQILERLGSKVSGAAV